MIWTQTSFFINILHTFITEALVSEGTTSLHSIITKIRIYQINRIDKKYMHYVELDFI